MRLDKFTTQQLGVSRTITGRKIRGNRVTVNGEIIRNAASKLFPEHNVTYNGNPLVQQHGPCYFMLNEPQGYAYSTDDPDHLAALYFLDEPVAWKLHTAGCLDIGTTGLVLITDDGQWSHHITSPCRHCEEIHLAAPESSVVDGTTEQFAKGAQPYNEKDLIKPAVLEAITPMQVRLITSEGRYRQVKRTLVTVGNHVVELHRERTGGIILDAGLALGEYRPLTEEKTASVV